MPLSIPLDMVFAYLLAQQIQPLYVKQSWYDKHTLVIQHNNIIGKCLFYDLLAKNIQGHSAELQNLAGWSQTA